MSSTIDSIRVLDSVKWRWRAASSCSFAPRLVVADSTPAASESMRSASCASASSVSARRPSSCSSVAPEREPAERLDLRAERREHRDELVGGALRLRRASLDARSAATRAARRARRCARPSADPLTAPAGVVETVRESSSTRWPSARTFAASSSTCAELPLPRAPSCSAATAFLSERSSLTSVAGALRSRARSPAPARPATARVWSRASRSRRRLAISPSFFAIADAVVATVEASVSTRSMSTSRRAAKRASCFESLLETRARLVARSLDASTTRYGEPAGILTDYRMRSAEPLAHSSQ